MISPNKKKHDDNVHVSDNESYFIEHFENDDDSSTHLSKFISSNEVDADSDTSNPEPALRRTARSCNPPRVWCKASMTAHEKSRTSLLAKPSRIRRSCCSKQQKSRRHPQPLPR